MNERIERVTFVLQHERERVSNLSRSMRSAGIDIRYLSMKSNNFFAILSKQSNLIHQQNVTLVSLLSKVVATLLKQLTFSDHFSDKSSDGAARYASCRS